MKKSIKFLLGITSIILVILLGQCYVKNRSKFPFKNQLVSIPINQFPSPTVSPVPIDFSAFADNWWHHGFSIIINRDGTGEADFRIYKWCSDDPTPPCDSMEGNNIISGGKATLKLLSINGKTASGQVISSSDPSIVMVAPFTLTILKYDMLEFNQGGITRTFCGSDFSKLAPKSILDSTPCGV